MSVAVQQARHKVVDSLLKDIIRDVRGLSHRYGVELGDLAGALGVDEKTLDRWAHKEPSQPRSLFLVKERLDKLAAFFEEADQAVSDKYLSEWLYTPNAALLGFSPVKCLSTPEGFEKVSKLVHAFRWGLP